MPGRVQLRDDEPASAREAQTLDGTTVMAKTIQQSWVSVTASRDTASLIGIISSRYVREAQTDTGTWLPNSSTWRWNRSTHTHNATYGLETASKDDGDPGVTTDDACTSTTYVTPDTTKWLINYPSQNVTTDCAATPSGANYLSGSQTLYDGAPSSAPSPLRACSPPPTR